MNAISRKTLCSMAATGAAVVITAAVAIPIAHATNHADVATMSVRIGDLDPHTAGGAQHIYSRLRRAAEQVCGDDAGTRMQLELSSYVRTCEQRAIEPAVDRIQATPLTEIFIHHFPERKGNVVVELDARG